VNEALLLTARHGKEQVGLTELLEGVSRTRYGVDGGAADSTPGALGKRLGRWLLRNMPPTPQGGKGTQAVKVAAS
jgi:hypothetical protein